jgi:hypothetical protein
MTTKKSGDVFHNILINIDYVTNINFNRPDLQTNLIDDSSYGDIYLLKLAINYIQSNLP